MKNSKIREKIDRELSGITLSDEMKEKIRSAAGGEKKQTRKMMQTAASVAAVMRSRATYRGLAAPRALLTLL